MMECKLSELFFDPSIYPRQQQSHKTIEVYVEALKAGAKFPPLFIQKVKYADGVKIVLLDGVHRLEAYRQNDIAEAECEYYKQEIMDIEKDLEELRLESAFRNIAHGDRLNEGDRTFQARRIVKANPKIENGLLSSKFGVEAETISRWVSDIRATFYASRDSQIYRLYSLGWTQEEIAELFEIPQPNVSNIIHGLTQIKLSIMDAFKGGKSIEEICDYFKIDQVLAWALILDGKSDLERFELFGRNDSEKKPNLYNVWNFPDRDKRLGQGATGNIPAQIVMNLLYYFTEQGHLVVDPMAGGGSTVDACLVMNRLCRAYDLQSQRKDISVHDLKNGIPTRAMDCDFVFLDPPYYDMVFEDLFKNIEDFYAFIHSLADYAFTALKSKGYVAILIQDMTEKGNYCLSGEAYKIFLEKGFKYTSHISCPLSTEQFLPQQVEKAKKTKHLLGTNRDLYVFRK